MNLHIQINVYEFVYKFVHTKSYKKGLACIQINVYELAYTDLFIRNCIKKLIYMYQQTKQSHHGTCEVPWNISLRRTNYIPRQPLR